MKKEFWFGGGMGLLLGILLTVFAMYQMAPSIMMVEDELTMNFDEANAAYVKSVTDNGWKMAHIHDLQKTMLNFGKDVKAVKVYEICHPDLAGQILVKDDERIVASMMPCRVAIYERSDGKVYVSRMNTGLMGGMFGGIIPDVMAVASAESEKMLGAILP
jgi:uncharacterized protein (DUF302 family)